MKNEQTAKWRMTTTGCGIQTSEQVLYSTLATSLCPMTVGEKRTEDFRFDIIYYFSIFV